MSGIHRLAVFVAALACISCAEPVPPPLPHAPLIATAPLHQVQQSCQGSADLPRVGGPTTPSDNRACDSRRGDIFAMHPPLLDGHYDFGHAPALRDLAQGLGMEGRPSPSPAAVQSCGYHLLNKVIVPFCVHGSN